MRAFLVRSAAVAAVLGAAAGMLVVLGLRWSGLPSHTDGSGTPRRYVDYLPDEASTHWWALLWPAGLIGLVVGAAVGVAVSVSRRAPGSFPENRGRRDLLALGGGGAVLGALVVLVLRLRLPDLSPGTVVTDGYVAPSPGSDRLRYGAFPLSYTTGERATSWLTLLAVGVGIGLALGLLLVGVRVLIRRRVRPVPR